jgi:hypothetical protein
LTDETRRQVSATFGLNWDEKTRRRIFRVTALITFAAVVFYLFFQVNKGGTFRDINPFGQDPYDAVGSFAIQGALLMGIRTYARALRLRDAPPQADKTRLILRGNALVLSAILVTLIADAIAEIVHPYPPSYWRNYRRGCRRASRSACWWRGFSYLASLPRRLSDLQCWAVTWDYGQRATKQIDRPCPGDKEGLY